MGRKIEFEQTISGSLEDVWQAWTTADGVTSFFAAEAAVKLEIGGPYELYFAPDAPEGSRGAENCKVLSYLPMEMLSFSWNAPPSIPNLRNAGAQTWVVVRFEELGEKRVRLRLTQLGIGTGGDWDAYIKYFTAAWPQVLQACKVRFEK